MATQAVSLLRFYGTTSLNAWRLAVAELAKGRRADEEELHSWERDRSVWILHMTSADMLRFLTHKLKSQSINEVQPFPAQVGVNYAYPSPL